MLEYLAYLFVAVPYVMAVVLAIVVILLVWSLHRTPVSGAVLVLAATLLEAAVVFMPPVHIGINIFMGDAVSMLLALGAITRLRHVNWQSGVVRGWVVFGLALMLSFVLGAAKFGMAAGSDFRTYFFYFWAGVAYFLTFEMDETLLRKIANVFITAGLLVVLLACVRWGADAAGMRFGPTWAEIGAGNKMRVVTAGETLVVATGAIYLLHRWLRREAGAWAPMLAGLMLLVTIAMQHRTVWGAVFLGVLTLVVAQRRKHGRSGAAALGALLAVGAVVVPLLLLGVGKGVSQTVGSAAQEALSERSTFTGRVEGWKALLSEWSAGGVRSYAIGQPFGSGYTREQQGATVSWTPHSYYVHMLLRTGFVGLVALLFAFVLALKALLVHPGSYAGWASVYIALLAAELAFFVPYSAHFEQSVFCGVALSIASRLLRSPDEAHGEEEPLPAMKRRQRPWAANPSVIAAWRPQ